MYSNIKRFILKVIPRKVLFRYEYFFRYFYYLGFIGNKVQCNVCTKKLSRFIALGDDQLCPRCGSIPRARRLWQILNNDFLKDNIRVLDFSPSRSIYRQMKKRNITYVSSDLSGDFNADKSYDITEIDAKDGQFDLIICYHVLEHVLEDLKAMQELWRVLDNGGHCLIQTPFKEGEIYEDNSITTPEDREKHFGQDDHVRIYSVVGLQQRLEKTGFKVEVKKFSASPENFNGFEQEETVLICSKPS